MQLLAYGLFLFILIFCPLAFGTVENWSQWVLVTVTAVSYLFLGLHLFFRKKQFVHAPGILPLFLLLGWMLCQLIPLPPGIIKVVAPATFELYQPLLALNPSSEMISLTINPESTLRMLFTFTGYTLFYLLTVQLLSVGKRLKQTVLVITALGSVIAVEAILQKLTSPDAIYWFRTPPAGNPVGPWVYSNHFAGFMEMLFPVVVALFLVYRPLIHYNKSLKEKFITILTLPAANLHLLLGTAAIMMAVSILISLSRGGIITLCIAFLFFIVFSANATRDKRTKWALFLTSATVLIVTWLGWQPIMKEFGGFWHKDGFDTSGRLPLIIDSIAIIKAYPVFGTGFGTFAEMYPAVRTIDGNALFDHAHNDYIELLVDGGLIGFVLCSWFVLSVLFSSLRSLRRRRERYLILVTSGALTGMLALLFHSLVDFQMYNGANALYFFFLCGLAVSAANTRFQFRTRPTFLPRLRFVPAAASLLLAFILLFGFTGYTYRYHTARVSTASLQTLFLNPHIPPARLKSFYDQYAQAAEQYPLEAGYRARLGEISLLLGREEQGRNHFLQAAMLRPMSGAYLQQLGLILPLDEPGFPEKFISLGVAREPRRVERYLTYADWLIGSSRKQDALLVLGRAAARMPYKTPQIARFISRRDFTLADLETALSPNPVLWYALGRIAEGNMRTDKAEEFYRKATDFADDREVQPGFFSSLYHLYRRRGETDKGAAVLRKGIAHFPEYVPFRILLGDYYRQQGIPYRAREEYQQAVNFDPHNSAARRRLEEISSPNTELFGPSAQ